MTVPLRQLIWKSSTDLLSWNLCQGYPAPTNYLVTTEIFPLTTTCSFSNITVLDSYLEAETSTPVVIIRLAALGGFALFQVMIGSPVASGALIGGTMTYNSGTKRWSSS